MPNTRRLQNAMKHHLRASPETCAWGYFDSTRPPAYEVESGDTIVIEQIRILQPEITYETGSNGSNIDQLQKNVVSAAGGGGSGSEAQSGDEGQAIKMIIKDLVISGGQLHYSNALLGGKTVDVALPEIRLTGIGEKSGGATSAEVTKEILGAINKKATSAIAGSDAINDLKGQLETKIKDKAGKAVGDKLQGLFNK